MKRGQTYGRITRAVSGFVSFFLLVAFIITCCLLLFLSALEDSMGVRFTAENVTVAAKATMVNVILISFGCAAIDAVRREFTVKRPVEQITHAASRMTEGDFSVRLKPVSRFLVDDRFNEIVSCFNKLAEELSGVETLRTDFIANVSHEMKTPLAVIRNYATLLKSKELSEEKRMEYADAISDASRRLSDMMTNVLRLSRLENQQIYPCTETFDLGEQLCESLLAYESVWEKRGIQISTELADGVLVSADRELLSLVWNNLFSNAFKFTDRGGKVSLSLATRGELAVVRISDTGCGMSPEVGAHIFEKFYQGDSSRATQGNGLGLALVRRVVDIVRGEIEVESREGSGTTFTVRIARLQNEGEKTD